MWPLAVAISYVDGGHVNIDASEWGDARGEAVDTVTVSKGGRSCVFKGHSVYWCYWQERPGEEGFGHWIVGSGTVGNVYGVTLPPEVWFYEDGRQVAQPIHFMPDLDHRNIKLGWWRNSDG